MTCEYEVNLIDSGYSQITGFYERDGDLWGFVVVRDVLMSE
jgi:hypothetical protein